MFHHLLLILPETSQIQYLAIFECDCQAYFLEFTF